MALEQDLGNIAALAEYLLSLKRLRDQATYRLKDMPEEFDFQVSPSAEQKAAFRAAWNLRLGQLKTLAGRLPELEP